MKKIIIILGASAIVGAANAQQVLTRTNLNSLLASSTTDDFERYFPGSSADVMNSPTLDSTSIINGQGPNLVNPGAKYLDATQNNLQWNGNSYFGINTKSILSNGGGAIQIDYAGSVQAMGLDARVFQGFGYSGVMDVYNGASIVGSITFSMVGSAGESVFLGWQNSGGITKAIVHSSNFSWSPIIDDHTYGSTSTVPEPATFAVLGIGALVLIRRRRVAK